MTSGLKARIPDFNYTYGAFGTAWHMCHRGKAIARAHGQQMSSDLIVRLRTGPGLLGTVEKYRRPARQGGRYKPFPPDFASLAVWPCGQHAVLDAPPRAHFIVNCPVFFSLFQ